MSLDSYKKLRILFMGTPEFAVESLAVLLQAGCNVVAVVTAPDKPAGRGMEIHQSEIKKFALQKGLPVLQPTKLKSPVFLNTLKALKPDLQICVAFRMLPEVVWNMPPLGTINLHGSLLPQYRGAAPINWAVINGEKETGVTTFALQQEIDTGNILMQKAFPIFEDDTAGTVHDKMKKIGALVLLDTVKALAVGTLLRRPQKIKDGEILHPAPKIFTETCEIDTNMKVEYLYNLVRGLSPYPTAFTFLNGKKLKIFTCEKQYGLPEIEPGKFTTDNKTFLHLACNDGSLKLLEIQLEGKKKMFVEDFLRGYRFS